MYSENFKADFLKMASATHATLQNTSHPHFLEYKRDLSIKITRRTCRLDTCRYLKLPNFKLRRISWEHVTYTIRPNFSCMLAITACHQNASKSDLTRLLGILTIWGVRAAAGIWWPCQSNTESKKNALCWAMSSSFVSTSAAHDLHWKLVSKMQARLKE